ncbi:MAG: sigma-70 family RNA polymerase sigma factor [Bryobacteraceae bacterium]
MPEEIGNRRAETEVSKPERDRFERIVLPHLKSAYNLARWLTRNEHDAEDVVQEAFLRALRSFETFQIGRDVRAWFLTIVRNTCCTWMRQNRPREPMTPLDDDPQFAIEPGSDPETVLIKRVNSQLILQALEEMPFAYREILVLRELEDLSYKEIAKLVELPLGTVMSRLSRARKELYARLGQTIGETRG